MRIWFLKAFIVVGLLAIAAYPVLTVFYNFSDEPPSKKIVFIPKKSSLSHAADILKKEGVINSASKFKILVSLSGKTQKIKPGEYEFKIPDHPINTLDKISKGRVKRYKFTVPEGYNAREIAAELEKKHLANREKFLQLIYDPVPREKYGIKSPSLEGYLFPETYWLDKTMNEVAIIKAMLKRFFSEVTPDLIEKGKKLGMDLHKTVTLASMIEKETGKDEERPLIASVFYNRLKKDMPLQCDPTVIYGIKDFDGNLKKIHLKKYNPYNTYVIKGLPKGPIANPGLASIKAAVEPADTKYLYFVAKKDGSHIFTKTYREHAKMVRKYQLKGKN